MKTPCKNRAIVKGSRMALALTECDKEIIEREARKRDMTMSAFIRYCVKFTVNSQQATNLLN